MRNIVVFYTLFLTAGVSNFTATLVGQLSFIALTALVIFVNPKKYILNPYALKLALVLFFIAVIQYIINGGLVFGMIKYLSIIFCCYLLILRFGPALFYDFAKSIYFLSLLSIPLYILQLIDSSIFSTLFSEFNFSVDLQKKAGGIYLLIFNLNPWNTGRNSGFMWEPGAFGAVVLITMLLFRLFDGTWRTKRIAMLSLVALTTFSTTTYLGLIIVLVMVMLEITSFNLIKGAFLAVLSIFIVIVFIQLPFMGKKIVTYSDNNLDYTTIFLTFEREDNQSIGRFAGMMIEFDRFMHNPLTGSGWDRNYSSLVAAESWSNPNGLAVIVGRFGLLGIASLFILLFHLSKLFRLTYLFEAALLAIIILMILFSNPFHDSAFVWMILLFGLTGIEVKRKRIFSEVQSGKKKEETPTL